MIARQLAARQPTGDRRRGVGDSGDDRPHPPPFGIAPGSGGEPLADRLARRHFVARQLEIIHHATSRSAISASARAATPSAVMPNFS